MVLGSAFVFLSSVICTVLCSINNPEFIRKVEERLDQLVLADKDFWEVAESDGNTSAEPLMQRYQTRLELFFTEIFFNIIVLQNVWPF